MEIPKLSTIIQISDFFQDEKKCLKYLAFKRWNNEKPTCPHCGVIGAYKFSDEKRYKCSTCRQQFTVTVGTIFEGSKIPLRKWFIAIFMVINHKKGISSHQLARDLTVTQKTAWFMLHRIRYALKQGSYELKGIIEADETFVGGKNKNRHWDKKIKGTQGRSHSDKTPVLGMIERGGEVRAFVIKNTRAEHLKPVIQNNVERGSTLMTDEWRAYRELGKQYNHIWIDHSKGQYAVGDFTTNRIENFWSHLKRGIIGVYHYTSPKHLQYYVNESTFRFNTRSLTNAERLDNTIGRCDGMRLTYKSLISNDESKK